MVPGDMRNKARSRITGILRYLALLTVVLAVVALLDLVPSMVDSGNMRRFKSIEALKSASGPREVLVPSFFPEGIAWPPALVLGQREPFSASILGFDGDFDGRRGTHVLVISQSSSASFSPGSMAAFEEIRQSVSTSVEGRDTLLETGLCRGGEQCSRLTWSEGGQRVELFMQATSLELIRIAESMLK